MRRYSSSNRYGGFGNRYPPLVATPPAMNERPAGDFPTSVIPPDIAPRRPSALVNDGGSRFEMPGESPDVDILANAIANAIARQLEAAIMPLFDGMRYARFVSFFVPPPDADAVVLELATTKRVYLQVYQCPPNDSVYVLDFGKMPNVNSLNLFDLRWDIVVPQDQIHVAFISGGNTSPVGVVYAELDPRAANRLSDHTQTPRAPAIPPQAFDVRETYAPITTPAVAAAAMADVGPAVVQQLFYVRTDTGFKPVGPGQGGQPIEFWRSRGYRV